MMKAAVAFATYYHSWIDWIGHTSGMPDKMLHVHAGLTILVTTCVLTRRSPAHWLPFGMVCLGEGFNEVMDRLYSGSWNWPDTSSDIAYTVFWPAVLLIALRSVQARGRY